MFNAINVFNCPRVYPEPVAVEQKLITTLVGDRAAMFMELTFAK